MRSEYRVELARLAGLRAWRLSDNTAGLHSTWVPGAGMLGASLVHRGQEMLWQGDGVRGYAEQRKFMGIPFLHPWANRLEGFSYRAGGHDVNLDPSSPLRLLDDNGPPLPRRPVPSSWSQQTRRPGCPQPIVMVPVPLPLLPEVWVQLNESRPRVHVYLVGPDEVGPPPTVVVTLPDFPQCCGQRLRTAHWRAVRQLVFDALTLRVFEFALPQARLLLLARLTDGRTARAPPAAAAASTMAPRWMMVFSIRISFSFDVARGSRSRVRESLDGKRVDRRAGAWRQTPASWTDNRSQARHVVALSPGSTLTGPRVSGPVG